MTESARKRRNEVRFCVVNFQFTFCTLGSRLLFSGLLKALNQFYGQCGLQLSSQLDCQYILLWEPTST